MKIKSYHDKSTDSMSFFGQESYELKRCFDLKYKFHRPSPETHHIKSVVALIYLPLGKFEDSLEFSHTIVIILESYFRHKYLFKVF